MPMGTPVRVFGSDRAPRGRSRATAEPSGACGLVRCSVDTEWRCRDWRRDGAALLGRFLPRLGPHLGAALFFDPERGRPAIEGHALRLPRLGPEGGPRPGR